MNKILITGSTSSQSSNEAHKRSARFSGLLNSAVNYSGNTANMLVAPVDDNQSFYDEYDSVVVGLAPISSMSANKIYAALNTVRLTQTTGKLKILFDAPDPHLVYQSFRSVLSNPSILTKDLYSHRFGYSAVASSDSMKASMLETIEFLLSGEYDVITPKLPYFSGSREAYGIPEADGFSFNEFNFDGLFSSRINILEKANPQYWVVETPKTKWAVNMSKMVSKPVIGVRKTQYDTESDYINRMQGSFGYLLNTYKNGTPWWSPHIMVALSCGIPVFSDWRYTGVLGEYWSSLPQNVESYSYEDRKIMAEKQKDAYLVYVPSWDSAASQAVKTILS